MPNFLGVRTSFSKLLFLMCGCTVAAYPFPQAIMEARAGWKLHYLFSTCEPTTRTLLSFTSELTCPS